MNHESQPAVARLDRAEFERLLAFPNAHLVVEGADGCVAGYVLAFPSHAPYDGEEFLALVAAGSQPFLYVDQVAVDARRRREGVASALYEALEAQAVGAAVTRMCCEVNLNPPNPISLAFHQRWGYRGTGVLETRDGRSVVLMMKELTGAERGS